MSQRFPCTPLAERLRPKQWQDVIGQTHLLALNKPLWIAFQAKKPYSMIFWGPPGVGKTTLARLCADVFDCEWIAISAVLAGVKDIRSAVEQAQKNRLQNRQTLLFIDEIHRFNKAQQDALLPFTESGLLSFIGATTENPAFEVNSALLSRSHVYVLKSLTDSELLELLDRTLRTELTQLTFSEEAKLSIARQADGDARRLLNLLEQVSAAAELYQITEISLEQINNLLAAEVQRRFDKGGDHFYEQISALHKSVRGSHPDASLYWLCRMLEGGVDPYYLCRRIIRMAWEDIGLADPRALQIANEAAATYERLGSPEGELALAQAVIYLSTAAKSNAGYKAYNLAREFVKQDQSRPVPRHIRNASTSLTSQLGYGDNYRYPHNEPYGYAAGETYLPKGLPELGWYQPVDRGLEIQIKEKLKFLRELDKEFKK